MFANMLKQSHGSSKYLKRTNRAFYAFDQTDGALLCWMPTFYADVGHLEIHFSCVDGFE